MSKRVLTSVLALLFSFFIILSMGMGGKPPATDEIVSISKVNISDNEILRQNKPIIVTFSAPMVNQDALDKPVLEKEAPFIISPAIKGDGRWLSENSYSFSAPEGYPRGENYTLCFKEDLTSLDGRPVKYFLSFRTEGVRIRRVAANPYDAKTGIISLYIQSSLPIKAENLQEHLKITDDNSKETLDYTLADMQRDASEHEIRIKTDAFREKIALTIAKDNTTDKTSLGMESTYEAVVTIKDPTVQSAQGSSTAPVVQRTTRPSDIHFDSPYVNNDSGTQSAIFYLTSSISYEEAKPFIKVTPDLPFEMEGSYRLKIAKGIEPGMKITVNLLPGLIDADGQVLQEQRSASITVPDKEPYVAFSDNGNYLTPAFGSRLGLNLLNMDRLSVTLYRHYDNNLPFTSLYSESDKAKHITNRVYDLTLKKNETNTQALDLESLASGQKGVFYLSVTGYTKYTDRKGNTSYRYQQGLSRLVVLSDIGITSRIFPSGATIFASSLSTGKPLPEAEVSIYSYSNQLIASGKTNSEGLLLVKRDKPWEEQLTPNIVTVQTKNDITFLPADSQTAIYLPNDAMRNYLDKGYEAFLYTPRGVFRPGETVDVKAFVRDAAHNPPAPFPVLFTVTTSRGLELARISSKLSTQGGANASITLPSSAPTGEYFVSLTIPGQNNFLGRMSFSVEDFVPPKLEVEIESTEDYFTGPESLPITLSGQYLFGAPGADLNYEIGYRVSPHTFAPKEWEGYRFGNAELRFASQSDLRYITGTLAKDGRIKANMKAQDWRPQAVANVQIVGSVQDDGGRWVTRTDSALYFPAPWLLGLKINSPLAFGKQNDIKIALVDPEGQAAIFKGTLKAEVFKVQGSWHTVYREGRYVYSYNERLEPVYSNSLQYQQEGTTLSFTPKEYGRYLVRCSAETAEDTIIAAQRYSVWGDEGEIMQDGSGRMDQVELSFDKKEYVIGETALLSVKAPYAGTLLLGIEKGEQLSTRIINMPSPATVVRVPVTDNMGPNATVTAWIYRPVSADNKEWYAHRAYGTIPLLLSKAPHTLQVSAATPERAEPSKGLSIPITVTDSNGSPVAGEFSVALIDEGILSLTAFKTPEPLKFFLAQRRSVGNTYDGFDQLLRPEAKATPLLKAGGDGPTEEDYKGSLSTEQIFLAGFLPTITTNEEGKAEAVFDIPEYSGKGRLMIVGTAGNSFASSASNIRFARDIVVEASAPRAVAPGDTFDISLKIFALKDESKDGKSAKATPQYAEIAVSVNDYLDLAGKLKNNVDLGGDATEKGTKTVLYNLKATAQKNAGVAKIAIDVKVPGRSDIAFTKYLDVVVRPPFPRTSAVKTALIKSGNSETLTIPGKWIKGTVKSSLSINKSPVFSVLSALEYLRDYPYGCLEQTVSRAWPYLTLSEVQAALYPEANVEGTSNNTNVTLQQTVNRILSMQTPEGGFAMWPGYSNPDRWKSVHAAFFLNEAKSKVAIPKQSLDLSLSYMRYLLAVPNGYFYSETDANTTKAYAAFVLTRAGKVPLSWLQHLSSRQDKMYPSGRIFLAGAKALHAGNPKALLDLKEKELEIDRTKLGYNYSLESSLRNQAVLLMLWSMVAPDHAETNKYCLLLAESLNKRSWYTTQDAGMASLAFGMYLAKVDLQGSTYSAEVTANGETLGSVENGQSLIINNASMPKDKDGNPEKIDIKVGGNGSAYVTYNVRGVSFAAPAEAAEDLKLVQTWKDASGKAISFKDGTAKLKKGDRITVEVDLTTKRSVADVVLSLLLPGGLEVENPRLATSGAEAKAVRPEDSNEGAEEDYEGYDGDADSDYYDNRSSNGYYTDIREDRILIFFDRLNVGSNGIKYSFTMRAVSSGTFTVPPPAAEGMYDPSIFATGATNKVVVE